VRCVLDPNVLVAALLSGRGPPAELVRLWLDGTFELVASPLLLDELKRVLEYPKLRTRVSEPEAKAFLTLLSKEANLIDDPARAPSLRSADPDDDYLVALAEEARAVIASGDQHLLAMAGKIPVYAPADLTKLLRAPESD